MLDQARDRARGSARRLSRRTALRLPPIRRLADQRDALAAEIDQLRREAAGSTGSSIRVEYPITPRVRDWTGTAGGDRLVSLVQANDSRYHALLSDAQEAASSLSSLTVDAPDDVSLPYWNNGWFPPLDGVMLTHFITTACPKTYLEIGSGNSTKFARRAIRAAGLDTRVVSIDPQPRAEIDTMCDQVIRSGLESAETLDAFRSLDAGDVVFFDGSHYCFQNSDVTAFFLELLDEIPSGSYYGIHDIFLPDDYPEAWLGRYYNEQYVLATWLLGGADNDEIVLPAWYVSSRESFRDDVGTIMRLSGAGPEHHGGAFWMKRA